MFTQSPHVHAAQDSAGAPRLLIVSAFAMGLGLGLGLGACSATDLGPAPTDALGLADSAGVSPDTSSPMTDATADNADGVKSDDAAAPEDSATPDTGAMTADAMPDTAPEPPPTAFGTIEGPCDGLLADLQSGTPQIVVNTFAFDGGAFDPNDLDPDAKILFDEPNAGGSSKCSEVFSMELMDACMSADLYKTETRIAYVGQGSITDYEMRVGETRYGVSVTRAYKGPIDIYSVEEAQQLLTKKLNGILESSANVVPEDAWKSQVLHVWTLHPEWADMVVEAWGTLPPTLQADTLVVVTLETGSDFVTTDTCDD